MSTTYTGSLFGLSSNPSIAITEPADGDPRNAASVNTPINKLADYLALVSSDYISRIKFVSTYDTGSATLNAGWSSGFASYYKDPGGRVYVTLKLVASATPSVSVGTLPAGYRPQTYVVGVMSETGPGGVPINGSFRMIQIDITGAITLPVVPGNGNAIYGCAHFSTTSY